MHILVFSDSHGEVEELCRVIEEERPDVVLHLGDHARDAEELCACFPALDIRYVRGNCDFGSDTEDTLYPVFDGVSVLMTHGHRYNVKYTLDSLANAAHFSGCALALFGHTHQSEYKRLGDVTLFNPGSCGMGRRSYGTVDIDRGKFLCRLHDL